jgi:hypothetical protein
MRIDFDRAPFSLFGMTNADSISIPGITKTLMGTAARKELSQ